MKFSSKLTVWNDFIFKAGGAIPQHLQVLKVKSVAQEECKSYHGATVHDSHLCTFSKAGEGVCSVSLSTFFNKWLCKVWK